MKQKGKYFLAGLLSICLIASMVVGVTIRQNMIKNAKLEDSSVANNAENDANQMLEEEDANLALHIVKKDTGIRTATGTTAMAGLAVITESISTEEDLENLAASIVKETEEDTDVKVEETEENEETMTEDAKETLEDADAALEEEETETEPEETWTEYELLFSNKVMANPDMLNTDALNIRSNASTDSEVVGKLYKGAWATIVDTLDNWYHIQSGNVDGWVCADYCYTGKAAAAFGKDYGYYLGTVFAERLNVRSAQSSDADCIGQLGQGEQCVINAFSEDSEWAIIEFRGTTAYVSAKYLQLDYVLNTAMTLQEEQAWIAEQARLARDNQVRANIDASLARGGATRQTTYITYEQMYLLASLVEMEVGGEPYDERLAVANIVLNRYYSGIWGYDFHSVIYAPGQFTGANEGVLAAYMASGPSSTSIQAVYDACAGYNNIGGYMYFCTLGKAASVNCYSSMYLGRMFIYQI